MMTEGHSARGNRTTVRLPEDLHRRAKLVAAWNGRKIQDLIAEAVEHYLPPLEEAMQKASPKPK
jgi:predicted DNA-binding protein